MPRELRVHKDYEVSSRFQSQLSVAMLTMGAFGTATGLLPGKEPGPESYSLSSEFHYFLVHLVLEAQVEELERISVKNSSILTHPNSTLLTLSLSRSASFNPNPRPIPRHVLIELEGVHDGSEFIQGESTSLCSIFHCTLRRCSFNQLQRARPQHRTAWNAASANSYFCFDRSAGDGSGEFCCPLTLRQSARDR